jgi:hypothetical protein
MLSEDPRANSDSGLLTKAMIVTLVATDVPAGATCYAPAAKIVHAKPDPKRSD